MKFRARLRALRERFGMTGLPVPILITEYVAPGPHDRVYPPRGVVAARVALPSTPIL